MVTNYLELATILQYLTAKWLQQKKLISCPDYNTVGIVLLSYQNLFSSVKVPITGLPISNE